MSLSAGNAENMEIFWRFVYERQMIFHKRVELGEMPPWTQDRWLANHHFCNVYRELDRGTQYIIGVLEAAATFGTPEDALWNILVYRYFNSIPTFDFLRNGQSYLGWRTRWDHREQASYLKYWEREGNQVFTGAFTVTGVKFGGYIDKVTNVCFLMERIQSKIPELVMKLNNADSFEQAYHVFLGVDGYGRFLAFQVAVDWAYFDPRLDRDSFAEAGPGCINGLKWLYPGIRGVKAFQEAIHILADNQRHYFELYALDFPYWQNKKIVASDIENCLCEYSKYMRLRTGHKPDGSLVRGGGRTRNFNAHTRIQPALI